MELRPVIIGIIADTLKVEPTSITDDTKLAEIAKDSIALFELLIRFEKVLGTRVQYEDIANIEVVGDIVHYAESLPEDAVRSALSSYATTEEA